MKPDLYTIEEVSAMIREGNILLLSGDAGLLSQLPKGDWIGACTPRFVIYPEQKIETYDKIFVSKLPDFVTEMTICEYDINTIKNVFNDGPNNGFTVLSTPFGSPIAAEYIINVGSYENFAVRPVCGYTSGEPHHPEKSFAISGTGNTYTNKIVAMHVSLPENKYAEIQTFNPYKQGDGDSIVFDRGGMILKDAYINGQKRNFAEYLTEVNYDTNVPFVANYSGEPVNVIINMIEEDHVLMATSVLENIEYREAVINYSISEPEVISDKVFFSMTCMANYVHPEICTRFLKKMNGPVSFGGIAYHFIGCTTIFLTIDDVQTGK